jgi:uncharacterized protein
MLLLLSPAKSIDTTNPAPTSDYSQPRLLAHSAELVAAARKLTQADLMELMAISEKIADLNVTRFAEWTQPFTPENSKTAVHSFTGDVYQGMNAGAWSSEILAQAQQRLRILSGLYGLLRPLDLMQAYRLEMGIGLRNERGNTLYAFWKNTITPALNADLAASGFDTVLNLASEEYFKAIDTKTLNAKLINVAFKEERNGKLKIISFSAKRARGMMADFVLRNHITEAADLAAFDLDNYTYSTSLSTAQDLVFVR